jgi:hypothetical protein
VKKWSEVHWDSSGSFRWLYWFHCKDEREQSQSRVKKRGENKNRRVECKHTCESERTAKAAPMQRVMMREWVMSF